MTQGNRTFLEGVAICLTNRSHVRDSLTHRVARYRRTFKSARERVFLMATACTIDLKVFGFSMHRKYDTPHWIAG